MNSEKNSISPFLWQGKALLTVREVELLVGLKRPTIYREMSAGRFPRPVHATGRARRWRADAVFDWVDSRPT